MVNEIEKKRLMSIAWDWIVLIVILILVGITALVPPFERQFKLDDITISHPHKGDTVKMVPMVVISMIFAIIVFAGFNYKNFSRYNFHQAVIGAFFAVSISTLFAHVIKMFVGRYRPDFISVCDVDFDKVKELYNAYNVSDEINYGPRNLFNTTICKTPWENLNEERRSFPSGHSCFIFSIMTYVSFFIAGQINIMDKRSFIWKYFVVSIPYLIAIMVALSRVFDYRHHWQDVTIGSILGVFFGIITYYYYFPRLCSDHPDIPYQRYEGYQQNHSGEVNEETVMV